MGLIGPKGWNVTVSNGRIQQGKWCGLLADALHFAKEKSYKLMKNAPLTDKIKIVITEGGEEK